MQQNQVGRNEVESGLAEMAEKFREGGWSFKKLHKLIVTSSTYKQSSAVRSDNPFMRCAAHSACIWLHGIPHTFSV